MEQLPYLEHDKRGTATFAVVALASSIMAVLPAKDARYPVVPVYVTPLMVDNSVTYRRKVRKAM